MKCHSCMSHITDVITVFLFFYNFLNNHFIVKLFAFLGSCGPPQSVCTGDFIHIGILENVTFEHPL